MKAISTLCAATLALCGTAALAQSTPMPAEIHATPSQMTPAQTAPVQTAPVQTSPVLSAPVVTTEAPKPIVVETTVDLTTDPGPPADVRAAREEAVNALHWARTEGCRSDPSPRDCIRRAQDEHRRVMAQLGGRG
jgi:hypothetical protein